MALMLVMLLLFAATVAFVVPPLFDRGAGTDTKGREPR